MVEYGNTSNPQQRVTTDEQKIHYTEGFIKNYKLEARIEADPRFSFNLSEFAESTPSIMRFSGFKDLDLHNGDFIRFGYVIKEGYNNFKYLIKHKLSNDIVLSNPLPLETKKSGLEGLSEPLRDIEIVKARADLMARLIDYSNSRKEDEAMILSRYFKMCEIVGLEIQINKKEVKNE